MNFKSIFVTITIFFLTSALLAFPLLLPLGVVYIHPESGLMLSVSFGNKVNIGAKDHTQTYIYNARIIGKVREEYWLYLDQQKEEPENETNQKTSTGETTASGSIEQKSESNPEKEKVENKTDDRNEDQQTSSQPTNRIQFIARSPTLIEFMEKIKNRRLLFQYSENREKLDILVFDNTSTLVHEWKLSRYVADK